MAFYIDPYQISGEENYTNNSYEFRQEVQINSENLTFECRDSAEPNNDPIGAKLIDNYLDINSDLCISSGDDDWFYLYYEEKRYLIKVEGYGLLSVGYYGISYEIENDLLNIQTYPLYDDGFKAGIFLYDDELNLLAESFPGSYYEPKSYLTYRFPCSDFLEPNNRPQDATEILEQVYSKNSLCIGESDWDWFLITHKGTKYYLSISGISKFYQVDFEISIEIENDILYVEVLTEDGVIGNLLIRLYDKNLNTLQTNYLENLKYGNVLTYSFFDIIYVNHTNANSSSVVNGSSWEMAFSQIQEALAVADSGDQVWIAKGTYFPTSCNSCNQADRDVSFGVPQFVDVIGGFEGSEVSLQERKTDSMHLFQTNATILSGNIGSPERTDDNSRVILQIRDKKIYGKLTTLDGLIFEEGYIDEDIQYYGVGNIYIPFGVDLEFRNCIFRNNKNYDSFDSYKWGNNSF